MRLNKIRNLCLFIIIVVCSLSCHDDKEVGSTRKLFDLNWKFSYESSSAAYKVDFDDSAWQHVDFPHKIARIPEDKQSKYNSVVNDTIWYRKTFDIPGSWERKTIYVVFEGISHVEIIFVNGEMLSFSDCDNNSCRVLISPNLLHNTTNLIAFPVSVENSPVSYEKSNGVLGVYKHVWLQIEEP
ncbi:sugar-binding domain-containing protein [Formosa sp. S-31]|uniref:sugar-binding domain-containing protein n=1 Tax=Formosa sp. S-31 TaxID=2790949 RepID=UPI003EBDEE65